MTEATRSCRTAPPPTPAADDGPLLLVDDDVLAGELLRELLEIEGYRVNCASTAAQARASVLQEAPRLVLCDLNLGDAHGTQVAEALQALTAPRDLPVWALTGHLEAEVRAMPGAERFERILQKPVDIDALLAQLRQRLGGR